MCSITKRTFFNLWRHVDNFSVRVVTIPSLLDIEEIGSSSAWTSITISLAPGIYSVSASVSAPNVTPFIGSRTITQGDVMTETFYIKTAFGGSPFFPNDFP